MKSLKSTLNIIFLLLSIAYTILGIYLFIESYNKNNNESMFKFLCFIALGLSFSFRFFQKIRNKGKAIQPIE